MYLVIILNPPWGQNLEEERIGFSDLPIQFAKINIYKKPFVK